MADSCHNTEQAAERQAVVERVRDALRRLPQAERQVLERVIDGRSTYRQAARALGIPDDAARVLLRSALGQLHATLRGNGSSARR